MEGFQSQNRDTAAAIPLCGKLPERARRLADFLQEVDQWPQLFDEQFVQYSISSYEHQWLPFAKQLGIEAVPPIHIEWVWLVHMLCPDIYQQDCVNAVGQVIDHRVLDPAEKKTKFEETRRIWKLQQRGATGSCLHWGTPDSWVPQEQQWPPSRLSYDIAAAVQRQKSFNYQVSLPHFKDIKFLTEGFQNYKRLLMLKKTDPDLIMVPGYDSDLVWHAHMACPLEYQKDTEALLGSILKHNDTLNDRSPGGPLLTHDENTENMWRATYGGSRLVPGGVFRGEPPTELSPFLGAQGWEPLCGCFRKSSTKEIRISFQDLPSWHHVSDRSMAHDFETMTWACLCGAQDRLLVKIFHSSQGNYSGAEIYDGERSLLASCKVLSQKELPQNHQVETVVPTYSTLAMLIRGQKGDWGIVTGSWIDYIKGIPGDSEIRRRGISGRSGSLKATFFPLGNCSMMMQPLVHVGQTLFLKGVQAQLKDGIIKLQTERDLPERLAVGLSLSIMHVLLQPRQDIRNAGRPNCPTCPAGGGDYKLLHLVGYNESCTYTSLAADGGPPCNGYEGGGGGCGGCGGCATSDGNQKAVVLQIMAGVALGLGPL